MFENDFKDKVLLIGARPYPDGTKIYENDIDSYDKLLGVLHTLTEMDFAFTEKGMDYLFNHYSNHDLYLAFSQARVYEFDYKEEEFDDFLDTLYQHVTDEYIILNNKDVIDIMIGRKEYPDEKCILLSDGPLKMDDASLFYILEAFREKLKNNDYDVSSFYDYFIENKALFIYEELDEDDYNYQNIYHLIKEYIKSSNDLEAVEKSIELVSLFKEEMNKPLEDRQVPFDFMEDYLKKYRSNLDSIDEVTLERIKKPFISFMNQLVEANNEEGIRTKAFAYYGGNRLFNSDYKISEECLLKLYHDFNWFNAADALGYIYYYGRVNNGKPEYEKAYQFYNIAALLGNDEAKYKIGDMIKNGYGVEKNIDLAGTIYSQVYHDAFPKFLKKEYDSEYADASFRMALIAEDRFKKELKNGEPLKGSHFIDMMKFLLCSLYAFNKRIEEYGSGFDRSTKGKIEAKLKKYYLLYGDKINDLVTIDDVLGAFYLFRISLISYQDDYLTLSFDSDYEEVLVDVKNRTSILSKQLIIKFKTTSFYLDKTIRYEEAKIKGGHIEFTPDDPSNKYDFEDEIDENLEFGEEYYYSDNGGLINENKNSDDPILSYDKLNGIEELTIRSETDKDYQPYYIDFTEFEVYPENRLIDLDLKEESFHCLKAVYYQGGKEYTFIDKDDLASEKIKGEAIVEETGQVVFVTGYIDLKETELPVDVSFMKHVIKKIDIIENDKGLNDNNSLSNKDNKIENNN